VLGLVGFAALNVIGLVPGALLGYGVGHVVGRKIKKKRLMHDFNKDRLFSLRLAAWIVLLKGKAKQRTPISLFLRFLEKALDEFRPALVMQLHSAEVSKQVEVLVKFLKTSACHTSLLNSVLEVEFYIEHNYQPALTAAKLRCIVIPVYHLLKMYYPALEVVMKVESLLKTPAAQALLETERCDGNLMGQHLTKVDLSENLMLTQLLETGAYNKAYHQKAYSKIVRGRPSSLPDDYSEPPKVRLSFKQQQCCAVFKMMNSGKAKAQDLQLESCDVSVSTPALGCMPYQRSFSIDGGMLELQEVETKFTSPPKVFEGFTNDLVESEESEGSLSPAESSEDECMPEVQEEVKLREIEVKVVPEIEVKVHPYIDCLEHILAIEAEPRDSSDWRQTVNKPETKIYTKNPKDSPLCMVKAFCEVPYPQEVVFQAIWDTSVRRQWDAVFNEFRLVDSHEFHDTLYYKIKTPFGFTKRDWVQRRTHLRDYPGPGDIIAHFISIEHPEAPPIKGIIRAQTIVSGYVFRSSGPNSCSLTIISQNDIKGLIPKMIVNRVASKSPADWVKSLYKGCELVISLSMKPK
jgi:steroidogenic acute regulatory protein